MSAAFQQEDVSSYQNRSMSAAFNTKKSQVTKTEV